MHQSAFRSFQDDKINISRQRARADFAPLQCLFVQEFVSSTPQRTADEHALRPPTTAERSVTDGSHCRYFSKCQADPENAEREHSICEPWHHFQLLLYSVPSMWSAPAGLRLSRRPHAANRIPRHARLLWNPILRAIHGRHAVTPS